MFPAVIISAALFNTDFEHTYKYMTVRYSPTNMGHRTSDLATRPLRFREIYPKTDLETCETRIQTMQKRIEMLRKDRPADFEAEINKLEKLLEAEERLLKIYKKYSGR
ncbi:MAG: hypothetical protein ACRC8S_05190 [Fimbriiglobus sp.]